jgi:predicted nucleotidyltransferase
MLYTSQEKEYKQAKKRAAEILSARFVPSNLEVAKELDKIAEEREGNSRRELLLRMRMEAKEIMKILKEFSPRLIGSVWRGTARLNSDIDILAFSQDHVQVLEQLQKHNFMAKSSEWRSVTKDGRKEEAFHIHLILPSEDEVEVVIRSSYCLDRLERCETYRDIKTGLDFNQLTKVLKKNPFKKFLPK